MGTGAKVSSVEAIETFRTHLLLYLSKARPTVEEISAEVMRTRVWLESEQRMYWEGQVRKRAKVLEEAQGALFSAEMSNLREATVAERMSVNTAKRALEEAETKLRLIKKWNRDFSSQVEPLAKQMERLHTVLASELPGAIAHLGSIIKTLHAYADVGTPASTSQEIKSAENNATSHAPSAGEPEGDKKQ